MTVGCWVAHRDLTAAAIAARIHSLEADVGTGLVTRAGRSVRTTEAGEKIFDRARAILREVRGVVPRRTDSAHPRIVPYQDFPETVLDHAHPCVAAASVSDPKGREAMPLTARSGQACSEELQETCQARHRNDRSRSSEIPSCLRLLLISNVVRRRGVDFSG
jgi:hypothetical protein